ncbi:hypothetical protein PL373_10605 [Tenacibaculum maritimum]|nr:hypothetical protein [Tenacibaculum maritimum]MDB0601588.1 hypothetical protein [Tenacibaculum maritimum]MDB0612867.1 hypothetical protein [Tenacibaculum maritimum]
MSKNNESLQSLEQLKELKNRYFTAFKDVKHSENTTFTVKLEHNYTNLLNLAHSLINVSQSAIEGLHENELPHCNSFVSRPEIWLQVKIEFTLIIYIPYLEF